jgi:hypothetical protein
MRSHRLLVAASIVVGGCSAAQSSSSGDAGATGDASSADAGVQDAAFVLPPAVGSPQIIVRHEDGHWIRIEPREGATPENLTVALDKLGAGTDDVISVSSDAAWLVLSTARFGCSSSGCLAVVKADLSGAGELLKSDGQEITTAGRPVIAPGGGLVVFEMATTGGHDEDLYATTRGAKGWSAPVLLTKESTHKFNHDPSLSPDGKRVAFDCGEDPYGDTAGTEACEVMTDGTALRVLFPLSSLPGATKDAYSQRPAYAPDGSIVMEANAGSVEEIYRVRPGEAPVLITDKFSDDNSPCVLRDGRIASLWLGRPENTDAVHELKVMSADGSSYVMLITLQTLTDVGLSCGG